MVIMTIHLMAIYYPESSSVRRRFKLGLGLETAVAGCAAAGPPAPPESCARGAGGASPGRARQPSSYGVGGIAIVSIGLPAPTTADASVCSNTVIAMRIADRENCITETRTDVVKRT